MISSVERSFIKAFKKLQNIKSASQVVKSAIDCFKKVDWKKVL